MSDTLRNVYSILAMMLFYSISVTLIAHFAPSFTTAYTGNFVSQGVNTDVGSLTSSVSSGLSSQTSLPVVELGALLFYSGNLVVDLFVNFITALPQMTILFFNILLSIISADSVLSQSLKLFLETVFFFGYIFGLISLLLNIRSGRGVQIQ